MAFEVETTSETGRTIRIHVTAADLRKRLDRELSELARRARLPGFRPGKVPKNLIEKRFGDSVRADTTRMVVESEYQKAITESDLRPVHSPPIGAEELQPDAQGNLKLELKVEVLPPFDVGEYQGIPLTVPQLEVTEAMVDAEVEKLRRLLAEVETVERPATLEDYLIANVEVALEDGTVVASHEGRLIDLPSGTVDEIPCADVKTKAVGAKAGDVLEFTIEIPMGAEVEDQRGKRGIARATIQSVQSVRLPAIDSPTLLKHVQDSKTVEEMRGEIQKGITSYVETQRNRMVEELCVEHLVQRVILNLPEQLFENAVLAEQKRLREAMQDKQVAPEEIEHRLLEIDGRLREKVEHDLKAVILQNRIAELEKVEVSEKDIEFQLRVMAAQANVPLHELVEHYQDRRNLSALIDSIRRVKVRHFLRLSAKPSETGDSASSTGNP